MSLFSLLLFVFVCVFVCLFSVCLFVCLFVCLSVCLFICLFVSSFAHIRRKSETLLFYLLMDGDKRSILLPGCYISVVSVKETRGSFSLSAFLINFLVRRVKQ